MSIARKRFNLLRADLGAAEQDAVNAETGQWLKQNRYDPQTETLTFTQPEAASYRKQITDWTDYFSKPAGNGGLPAKYIKDPEELRQLTPFLPGPPGPPSPTVPASRTRTRTTSPTIRWPATRRPATQSSGARSA